MSEPYLGEIRQFGFGFAPRGWAACNGQTLSIAQNQALFAILGTTYGGDGISNFKLPNLQGSVPVHVGNGISLGQVGGEINHTLILNEMAAHNHLVSATTTPGNDQDPTGDVLASAPIYQTGSADTTLDPSVITPTGGGQPHNNLQPCLTVFMAIALQGIFPSRN
jgi:microcystin-dependent protein